MHVARGQITVNSQVLGAGDAIKTAAGLLTLENGKAAEVLVFDLP